MEDLGYFTDLFIIEAESKIIQMEDWILVQSPDNPTYFFGNFLLLNNPPLPYQRQFYEKKFHECFKDLKKVKHFTFCWRGADKKNISDFTENNYEFNQTSVLIAKREDIVKPKQLNDKITIRSLSTDVEWQEWIAMELGEKQAGHSDVSYRVYLEGKAKTYKNLTDNQQGHLFAAYIDNEMVAAAGLFHKNKIGRFQQVTTKSGFRRRGICKSLIYQICMEGFKQLDSLVMLADIGYFALDVYKKLGFQEKETQSSLCWWKRCD